VDLDPGAEAHLQVTWFSNTVTPVVPAGHVVAWDDLELDVTRPAVPAVAEGPAATAALRDDGTVLLSGGNSAVVIDAGGVPRRLVLDGVIVEPSWGRIGLWRAPTDNDAATFGDEMVVSRLERAGLARAEGVPAGPPTIRQWVDGLHGGTVEPAGTASARWRLGFADRVQVVVTWLIGSDGEVAFDIHAASDLDVPPLLRVGLEMEFASSQSRVLGSARARRRAIPIGGAAFPSVTTGPWSPSSSSLTPGPRRPAITPSVGGSLCTTTAGTGWSPWPINVSMRRRSMCAPRTSKLRPTPTRSSGETAPCCGWTLLTPGSVRPVVDRDSASRTS
jgi:hypothetical protein